MWITQEEDGIIVRQRAVQRQHQKIIVVQNQVAVCLTVSGLCLRGLAEQWNSGCLGARLSDIVKGHLEVVVVCNYMIDLEWLLATCPDIKAAHKVRYNIRRVSSE